jgi:hypothetical protein
MYVVVRIIMIVMIELGISAECNIFEKKRLKPQKKKRKKKRKMILLFAFYPSTLLAVG